MDNLDKFRKLAKHFKNVGNENLSNKLLLIISANTGLNNPRSDLSYSYIIRKLRKNDKENLDKFMKVFKNSFDDAYIENLENPEQIALLSAIKVINFNDET
jgi:hypothetical protein